MGERVFFRVLTDSGKNYRILISESDMPILRVSSIKKNLTATTSIPAVEQALYFHGRELQDYETGEDIGLQPGAQLVMRRSNPTVTSPQNQSGQSVYSARDFAEYPPSEVIGMAQSTHMSMAGTDYRTPVNQHAAPPRPARSDDGVPVDNTGGRRGMYDERSVASERPAVSEMRVDYARPDQTQTRPAPVPTQAAASFSQWTGTNVATMEYDYDAGPSPDQTRVPRERSMIPDHRSSFARPWQGQWGQPQADTQPVGQGQLVTQQQATRDEDRGAVSEAVMAELEDTKRRMVADHASIQAERKALEDMRVDFAKRWEMEQEKWTEARVELVESYEKQLDDMRRVCEEARREADRARESAASRPAKVVRDDSWRKEKDEILNTWGKETEKLTNAYNHEKAVWESEKAKLQQALRAAQDGVEEAKTQAEKALRQEMAGVMDELETANNEAFSLAIQLRDARVREDQLKKRINDLATPMGTEAAESRVASGELSRLRAEHETTLRQLQKEALARRQLHNTLEDIRGAIRVVVRVRPTLPGEDSTNALRPDAHLTVAEDRLTVHLNQHEARGFDFYRVLGEESTQEDTFAEVEPLVQSTVDGYNLCIISYGQTGSGKTFTIIGAPGKADGVVPRAIRSLFHMLDKLSRGTGHVAVISVALVELYLDKLTDLIPADRQSHAPLAIRQGRDGQPRVQGLGWHTVTTADEAIEMLMAGLSHRHTAQTAMNETSSRSHTVFTVKVRTRNMHSSTTTESRLTFADLAGSERVAKSHSAGDRLREAQSINTSLSALGDVVTALCAKRSHIPYRNSKLTMLLQPSLGGNSKTVLFANVSGVPQHVSETQSTLSFASKVKTVKNVAIKNLK
ncbi:Kinesin motor domain [Carpediemonas membranifera]|uniref:Kinesin motor domain n=1 Tax=Carpediemonas membranifera TaxID=201153 RepID=A0A8J6E252_9EUKA|nr:Kinesin motor domain [Carpediemonas membranifera]|eukprot:KAG9391462.1 Kinesin motor domain [Carpediemonas membranifera]